MKTDWQKYFKLKKYRPGVIITAQKGPVDFSRDDLSLNLLKELYESDFPYLEITHKGKEEIYGVKPRPKPTSKPKSKKTKSKPKPKPKTYESNEKFPASSRGIHHRAGRND